MLGLALGGCGAPEPQPPVLVVVNGAAPLSVAIGEYYVATRAIPPEQLLRLDVPVDDPTLRSDAHERIGREAFERRVRAPIEALLRSRGWADTIETLVVAKGVPLLIGGATATAQALLRESTLASVDAELSLLFSDWIGSPGIAGSANPYFGSDEPFAAWRRRHPEAPLRYLVGRLTGYAEPLDPETGLPRDVRRLIDAASAPPLPEALWLVDEDVHGDPGLDAGNHALLAPAAAALRALGVPLYHERSRRFPRNLGPLAGFASWGSNASADPGPPFWGEIDGELFPGSLAPRSVVVTLVSSNARSFATPPSYGQSLVADLVRLGAAGVAGHVREPGLVGVPRPQRVLAAVARGVPAGEAFYRGLPYLGWTHVWVGDPLMRAAEPRAVPDDRDGDGVPNAADNCSHMPNPGQRDSDGDGFGNRCDADVDGDGLVTTSWGALRPTWQQGDVERIAVSASRQALTPDHDLDGDGRVSEADVALAQLALFHPPGPSGTTPPPSPSGTTPPPGPSGPPSPSGSPPPEARDGGNVP